MENLDWYKSQVEELIKQTEEEVYSAYKQKELELQRKNYD